MGVVERHTPHATRGKPRTMRSGRTEPIPLCARLFPLRLVSRAPLGYPKDYTKRAPLFRGIQGAAAVNIPIETTTLSNGLKVVVAPDITARVVTVRVCYKIGFRLEPQGRSGFAHLFEHMMFQGSAHAPKMQHIKPVNSSGGTLNGSTHYDVPNYFEHAPSTAPERVLPLSADRMRALQVEAANLRHHRNPV